MVFVSEKQRRHVMGLMSRLDKETNNIRVSSDIPLMVSSGFGDKDALEKEHKKLILKFENEEKKIEKDIKREERNIFSDKSRGSVPLLETTFVIRGGTPKERQNVKKILDIIGTEPPLKDYNTVRILEDLDQPVVFEDEKTVAVKDTTLHAKGDAIPVDLAVMMLTMAYKIKSPQVSDENAAMYAKKVVYSAIEEMTEREKRRQELESIEVYQAGAEEQPLYEITPAQEPSPIQATLISSGAPDTGDKEVKERIAEAEKQSLYYMGGL